MPVRRYAPALVVAAALLLLVVIAPSKAAPKASYTYPPFSAASTPAYPSGGSGATGPAQATVAATAAAGAGRSATGQGATGQGATGPGATGPGTAGTGTPGTTDGPATAGGPTGTTGRPATSAKGGRPTARTSAAAGARTAGSTAHCVNGKQFQLAGYYAAPPCQPTFSGSNGGATYAGVTATTVTVVYYRMETSAAEAAVLNGTGVLPTTAQLVDYLTAEANFINTNYELWGRRIVFQQYQSQSCSTAASGDDCFRQDADTIISTFHPFAVVYPQDTASSGFQDELTSKGVIAFGGLSLPESFSTSRRPFHYDYTTDGDTQVELAGEFYCKQLANSDATFAGEADLQKTPRKAEILVSDDPVLAEPAARLETLINNCDHGGGATIKTYSRDTATAAAQSTTLASQAKQNGITTLLYFSDPVAPIFLTPALTTQNYFPENVTVGSGFLDSDVISQLYDTRQWANAFGLGDLPQSQYQTAEANASYTAGGGKQTLFNSADTAQGYLSVVAAGIQQAGADLNPGTFEHGVLTLPAYGGVPQHELVKYGAGDYAGSSDARVSYWSTTAISPLNGKAGSWLPLEGGSRFAVGGFPSTPLTIPGKG